MKINGRLIVCERCKKEIFCKVKSDVAHDDNLMRCNKFEDAVGWSYVFFVGDLCPRCTKKYEKFKNGSKRSKYFAKKVFKTWRMLNGSKSQQTSLMMKK